MSSWSTCPRRRRWRDASHYHGEYYRAFKPATVDFKIHWGHLAPFVRRRYAAALHH